MVLKNFTKSLNEKEVSQDKNKLIKNAKIIQNKDLKKNRDTLQKSISKHNPQTTIREDSKIMKKIKAKDIFLKNDKYPPNTLFMTDYLLFAEKERKYLGDLELLILKDISTRLMKRKEKDILYDLFNKFNFTIKKLSKELDLSLKTVFEHIHKEFMQKSTGLELLPHINFLYWNDLKKNNNMKKQTLLQSYFSTFAHG